jgi:hypothetical protein
MSDLVTERFPQSSYCKVENMGAAGCFSIKKQIWAALLSGSICNDWCCLELTTA